MTLDEPPKQESLPLTDEQKLELGISDVEARYWSYFPATNELQQVIVGSPRALELLTPTEP